MFKKTIITSCFTLAVLIFVGNAYAHVTVKPAEVGVGKYQTFTISVPVEKDVPTTGLRLVIPESIESVMPNVKPGWKIDIKKEGEGENAKVTEITWTGGTIPVGQRDEFYFSAKTPAKTTTLQWKAYQTYQNGTIVAWDKSSDESKNEEEGGNSGPYSQTKIIDDLSASPKAETMQANSTNVASNSTQNMIGYVALGISLISLVIAIKKK